MRTKFWRFAYNEIELKNILNSNQLLFPNLTDWPLAKNNTEEKVIADLNKGDFILLANFNPTNEIGTVRGVGRITEITDDSIVVLWKKPIPSWSLSPNRQGGVPQWNKEGVFCFDAPPAKRYKLNELTLKLFKNA